MRKTNDDRQMDLKLSRKSEPPPAANGAGAGSSTHRMITTLAGTEARIEIKTVTPEMAKKWLALNCKTNRKISIRTVEAYAREIKAGRWQLTHQAIAFNQTGELIDGQHRLSAVVLAKKAIKAYISTGLPLEYNAPIDQGYGRRVDQIMGKSPRYVSVIRGMFYLENANLGQSFKTQVGLIEELAHRHGTAVDQVMAKGVGADGIRVPAGFLSAAAYALPISPEKVLSFVQQVHTGELLVKHDPAHTIRRWFLQADRHSTKEILIASCNSLAFLLKGKPMIHVTAGRGDEREGVAGYLYLCQKRRVLKLPATPTADQASFKAMAEASSGRTEEK